MARSLFQEAHRLKGAAGTLQLSRLEAIAARLASAFGAEGPQDDVFARDELVSMRRELAAAAAEQLALPDERPAAAGSGSLTVLHVEDDPVTARLFERLLAREAGVTLVLATSGADAIEFARRHRPDLVVLDLHLPDMHGAAVIERLRQDPATAELPIVITTGGTDAGELERLLASGVRGYLEKPLDFGRLRELVGSFRA